MSEVRTAWAVIDIVDAKSVAAAQVKMTKDYAAAKREKPEKLISKALVFNIGGDNMALMAIEANEDTLKGVFIVHPHQPKTEVQSYLAMFDVRDHRPVNGKIVQVFPDNLGQPMQTKYIGTVIFAKTPWYAWVIKVAAEKLLT